MNRNHPCSDTQPIILITHIHVIGYNIYKYIHGYIYYYIIIIIYSCMANIVMVNVARLKKPIQDHRPSIIDDDMIDGCYRGPG